MTTPAPGATPPAPAASTHSTTTTRETENVSYELSRIVAKTLTTPGEVQRVSMAVMLNTNTKTVQGADKKEVREPAPRSPEEMEKIRRIVMGAVSNIPYQVEAANTFLDGKSLDETATAKVADLILEKAHVQPFNGYKIPIARTLIHRTLMKLVA